MQKVLEKLSEIVCTTPPDDGVVLLSNDSPTHYDPVRKVQVYDHEHFSPLGDALIELHDLIVKQSNCLTSVSMVLRSRHRVLDLVEIAADHVMLRDWTANSIDAFDATIVVRLDGAEHVREVRIPRIESGQCRVDVVDIASALPLEHYHKQNAKRFVMACDGRVSAEEAEEIAEQHIQESISRNYQ